MTSSAVTDQVHTRTSPDALDAAELRASGEDRTVVASLSSDAPLMRYGEVEVLSHAPGAVDLTRAADGGLPLLLAHDSRSIPVGTVESIRIEGGRLRGRLRFGTSARAEEARQAVRDGVLRSTSVGFRVLAREPIVRAGESIGWRITSWELLEVSLVAVPFDPTVGVGRSFNGGGDVERDEDTRDGVAADDEAGAPAGESTRMERSEAVEIVELCTRSGLSEMAAGLLRSNASMTQARSAVLAELSLRDAAAGGHLNVSAQRSYGSVSVFDNRGDPSDVMRDMAEALAARNGGPAPSERARPYMRLTPMDMARDALERRGIKTSALSVGGLYERAMGTGDFPVLLSGAGQRLMLQPYQTYTGGIRQIARESTARDFRVKTSVRLGEAPALRKVNEHGEFTHGALAEAKETYRVETFGRIVSLTRQAIVNDDLRAFADLSTRMGWAALEFECQQIVSLLTAAAGAGPTLDDGVALFDAAHGNLAAPGTVIDVTNLGVGRKAMRMQKGLDQVTPIDVRPRYLVVPAALETVAEQYLATLQANVATSVNPFGGQLAIIVDPRLDVASVKRWYLAADPAQIPTIEYSYLEDEQGPRLFVDEGFTVDGVSFKVRLDYGCGVLDYRGLYANPGPSE